MLKPLCFHAWLLQLQQVSHAPRPSPVPVAGLFWLQAGRKNNTVAGVQNIRGLLFFEVGAACICHSHALHVLRPASCYRLLPITFLASARLLVTYFPLFLAAAYVPVHEGTSWVS